MTRLQNWVSDNPFAAVLVLMVVIASCNYVTTGDVDGRPHETCIDNPRNNDQQCWPDPGYHYDGTDVVPDAVTS